MREAFWEHAPLHTAAEVMSRPSPVPSRPGVYAWFFRQSPQAVDASGAFEREGLRLLYVGISPKAPPRNGRPSSTQNLYKRVQYHYTGNAEGSMLRLTLGCLLADELGIELRRVGSGKRMTFSDGERILSEWMATNALVAVMEHPEPWIPEPEIIGILDLPLNIEHNAHNPQRPFVRGERAGCKARARELPILPR
jgi:GIY-YIG catalytic domain